MLEQRKKELLLLAQEALGVFLDQHPGLRYYCFALDCNAAYAEINLCLNTEEAYLSFLKRYHNGPYASPLNDLEDLIDLRYNTGNWEYQCFETFYTLEEDELARRYGDDEETLVREMMAFNQSLLDALVHTDAFRRIPKTDDFRILCIDHDEEVAEALARTASYFPV